MPPGYFQQCDATLAPTKQAYITKEHSLYPKQPSAIDNQGGGPNMQAGNYGPNNMPGNGSGPNNMMQQSGPAFSPAQCQAQIPSISKGADACMRISSFDSRKACFDQVGNAQPNGFWDQCRAQLDPLKQQYMAQEHQKYPTQPSALGGDNNGPSQAGNNGPSGTNRSPASVGPPAPATNCSQLISSLTPMAQKCLTIQSDASRQACGNGVGNYAQQHGYPQSCESQVDTLHNQIIQQEKSKFKNSVL